MPKKNKNSSGAAPGQDQLESVAEGIEGEEDEPEIGVFRPEREGIRKVLGDLEADIMEYIWNLEPPSGEGTSVRQIYEAFRLERTIAYTTVMTTMARLARKHLLVAHKKDNTYLYAPVLSREQFIDNFVSRILENLLVSFSQVTEVHLKRLAEENSPDKIAHLRQRLDSLRSTRNRQAKQGHNHSGSHQENERN
ncbi:MAG TPA: BlaI/MecI/CopY family transcriptional regulator [Chloroflexia bacterium]|nr:BlaI/MecI/CopY family transcriptional regulator [Chloroflexia bacterium]